MTSAPKFDYSIAGKTRLTPDEVKLVRLMERILERVGGVSWMDQELDKLVLQAHQQQGKISYRRLRAYRAEAKQNAKARRSSRASSPAQGA